MDDPLVGSATEQSHDHVHKQHTVACILLHIGLLALHGGLFAVYSGHYEHNLNVPLTMFATTWLPLIVTTTLQTLGTLYLAVLVLSTQRLALRNDMYTRQTLTAIHDKSTAWLGLGSAVTSLWQQLRLPTATTSILAIAAYLLGIFALHITIPGLFHVVPYNATVVTVQPTILENASYAFNQPIAYDILSVYGQIPTPGLLDNMVYDLIPALPTARGAAFVNASLYDVDCGYLAVKQADPIGAAQRIIIDNSTPDTKSLVMPSFELPYSPAVYAGQTANTADNPVLFASTLPVMDAHGVPAPVLTLDPVVQQLPNAALGNREPVLIRGLYVLACNVHINYTKVLVSAETRQPLSPPYPDAVVAKNWTMPQTLDPVDPRLAAALASVNLSPPSSHREAAVLVQLGTGDVDAANLTSVTANAFDVFVTEDLGIIPQNRTNITVAELNRSVGRAMAAIYWYGKNVNYTNFHATLPSRHDQTTMDEQLEQGQGEADILISTLRVHLHLSLAPLIAGAVASVALLVLAILLIRLPSSWHTYDLRAVFDSAGVLELTWLFGNEPVLARVRHPTLRALRAAGMYDVQLSERAQEKVYLAGKIDRLNLVEGSSVGGHSRMEKTGDGPGDKSRFVEDM